MTYFGRVFGGSVSMGDSFDPSTKRGVGGVNTVNKTSSGEYGYK